MSKMIVLIFLLCCLSCRPSYCDECINTSATFTVNGNIENVSGYTPNIITEPNTYFSFIIEHSEVTWNSAHIKMYNSNSIFLDTNQGININTSPVFIDSSAIVYYYSIIKVPIELISQDGEYPTGKIFIESSLKGDVGDISMSSVTYSYKCEDIVSDKFGIADCLYSCHISNNGYFNDCNSQNCPE